MPDGDLAPRGGFSLEQMLSEDVPLPGSVAGRRIVKIDIGAQEFRKDIPPDGLFTALGFALSGQQWRYDRARVLDWFLGELKALNYNWAQDPWQPASAAGQPQQAGSDAGPRPTGSAGGTGGKSGTGTRQGTTLGME